MKEKIFISPERLEEFKQNFKVKNHPLIINVPNCSTNTETSRKYETIYLNICYFLIRNSNENNLIYLLLTREQKQMDFDWIVYWASSNRLSSFVHHVVVDVKLGPQEKLFVLTIFSGFIGLCRVSIM